MIRRLATVLIGVTSLCAVPSASALKSDADQPATINADDVELDFRTGERIYTGNVFVRQGSMELTCDKLVATFKDDKLAVATAFGSAEKLAVFKQRPDDQPNDVIGKAVTMVLDQIEQLVTLTENASLNQGTDTVTGQKILYDMKLEKMRVKGSQTTIQQPSGSVQPDSSDSDTTAASDTNATGTNSALPKAAAVSTPDAEVSAQENSVQDAEPTTASTTAASTETDTATAKTTDIGSTDSAVVSETETEPANPQMVVPNDSVLSRGTSGRPRMIIQPRSKRNP